jgi:alpha-D-ribose 1-methylphosphonate 5-triphosphate diphosphatase
LHDPWRIEGGQILDGDRLRSATLHLGGGRVATTAIASARRFDASGLLVLPGLVDIHGDALERALQPRPGVDFPAALALRDTAAQLLATGITTAYLGVTLSWEPGLRSIKTWRALTAALGRTSGVPDIRVHLRFEADNFDALDDALTGIAAGSVHLLGFNDHTLPILGRMDDPQLVAKYAGRAGLSPDAFRALAASVAARRGEIPAARARLAAAARAAGIPMLSHDDATPEDRAHYRAHGATICEFPMSEAVAADARAHGEAVVMGAPNVVRGGSHLGWSSAAPLAERGLVTVLASDYHWPAMLEAAFALTRRPSGLDLPHAWALVAANPAAALGLTDRGTLLPGRRGDVVIVNPDGPTVVAVFCAGRLAHLTAEGAARLRR